MELRVAVLAGGGSPEASVSRSSAGQVAAALRARHKDVLVLELDANLTATLSEFAPDVVFPVLHGPPGEDGTVQGHLEMLGLPYVGSDVRGSALGMDKHASKALFRAAGLPVLDEVALAPDEGLDAAVAAVQERFGSRVVVKPSRQGSALGVTPLPNGGDLRAPIAAAQRFGDTVIVEPFVQGREITVGVLDLQGEAPQAWPAIEIVTAPGRVVRLREPLHAGQERTHHPSAADGRCDGSGAPHRHRRPPSHRPCATSRGQTSW